MGNSCSRKTVIDAIPDKSVMLEVVDRIVAFEQMLKKGEQLGKYQEQEKKQLECVARAMKKVQRREKTLVKNVSITVP
jgi:hypothetical protein